jgi:PAS domain-containing protein
MSLAKSRSTLSARTPGLPRTDAGRSEKPYPGAPAVSRAAGETALAAAEPATLILDKTGRITDANVVAERIFDYRPGSLAGIEASQLVPTLTGMKLSGEREFRRLKYLARCGFGFAALKSSGESFACGLAFVEFHRAAEAFVRIIVTERGAVRI